VEFFWRETGKQRDGLPFELKKLRNLNGERAWEIRGSEGPFRSQEVIKPGKPSPVSPWRKGKWTPRKGRKANKEKRLHFVRRCS